MVSWKYVAQLVTSGAIESLDSEGKRILFENIERMAVIADLYVDEHKTGE